ncbi:unknown protein [Cronobacter turicensis z3032]|uniref:Heterokaryon incompatibility domain-containing protein n=1 Tax=Cronobacter turicensis (strain DSM 18703 / CCUG 55852 / LMG 23827 / z3032) TaxID=693216 RepID=C9XXB9_CROTZ|nr:unknown protein [Cronobacter turicensis z3032]
MDCLNPFVWIDCFCQINTDPTQLITCVKTIQRYLYIH